MAARTETARTPLDDVASAGGRPVLLATLGVPFQEMASSFAVDTAVESGQPLIVANVTRIEPLSLSIRLGYDALEELTPEVTASVRRPVELAASLGVPVERLRIRSPRPISALVQLVTERRPGILVFGPDRQELSGRVYRRAVRVLRDKAPCLLWTAPETT